MPGKYGFPYKNLRLALLHKTKVPQKLGHPTVIKRRAVRTFRTPGK